MSTLQACQVTRVEWITRILTPLPAKYHRNIKMKNEDHKANL